MQVLHRASLHQRASCIPPAPCVASSSCSADAALRVRPVGAHKGGGPAIAHNRSVKLSSLGALSGPPSWALVAKCLPPLPLPMLRRGRRVLVRAGVSNETSGYASAAVDDPAEAQKRAQVAKRLERTAGYFKRLGTWGFWTQLVCTVVSSVILAFSLVITGSATAPVSLYLTTAGIVAAFLSVFWSFGYIRLAQKLRSSIADPTKAPPRAEVIKNLRNGLVINILGLGSTILGLQATVGALVAKALTSSASPYLQGPTAGHSPVLALDVFLVQASGNAILSHYLGLLFSLELLRAVTVSQPPPDNVIPKVA